MDNSEYMELTEVELSGEILNVDDVHANLDSLENCVLIVCDGVDEENELQTENPDDSKKPKLKRRANLTEFSETQSTKRKNETAKRELSSIVKQLEKIDKQLNGNEGDPRASINFVATFNSFQSNRVSTFKYPAEADIKPTLLGYDNTISAIKIAVKEVMTEFIPQKEIEGTFTASSDATPTKTISAFTSIPSPVAVKRSLPSTAKNLCAKNSCTFGKKLKKPVWIKCSYGSDGVQNCNYWVHAPCIGFPNLKEADVKLLGEWCCPDHTETCMKRK